MKTLPKQGTSSEIKNKAIRMPWAVALSVTFRLFCSLLFSFGIMKNRRLLLREQKPEAV